MIVLQKYVVLDVETTGQSAAKGDRIIEIAIVIIENNQITAQYNQLINPEKPIPAFISQLTSITDEDVATMPIFAEVVADFIHMFDDAVFVAHNVYFDLTFLNEELERNGHSPIKPKVLDTVELARILLPKASSYKLNELAEYLLISHENPHRAISDALVTADLFILLLHKLQSLPQVVKEQLRYLSRRLRSNIDQLGELLDSPVHRNDIDIFRGFALKSTDSYTQQQDDICDTYGDFLEKMYGEDGQLASLFTEYEKRPSQQFISEKVYDHFRTHEHALIEAETGLGKTIAYLIPAVYESLHHNQRVVISTTNTNLQSQLIEQDLKKLQVQVPTVIVKGKNHYLSLQKFEQYYHDTSYFSYQDVLFKSMILVWLTETTTGDLDEIQFAVDKQPIYHQIIVNHERTSTPWKDYCFYRRMLKKAASASIIVTNHALLTIDSKAERPILPSYHRLIVDEAHQLEQVATNHSGLSLSYFELTSYLQLLEKNYGNLSDIPTKIEHVKYEADILFRQLFQVVKDENQKQKAVTEIGRFKAVWEPNEQTKDSVDRTVLMLTELCERLEQIDEEEQKQLIQIKQKMHRLLAVEDNASVTWLEIDQNGAENAVFVHQEPFSVQQLLHDQLFNQKEAIILISATLTMNKSFQYIRNKLGMNTLTAKEYMVEHHFDYKHNVELLIPDDLPAIQYPRNDDFIYAVNEAIISLSEKTDGRMLVLFTSYDMLRKSYYLLKESDYLSDYMIIGQGVTSGSRNRLIKQFQGFDKSILLGTNAYWQGIDIPGEDLSCLMIVKLPFQSPQDPVYKKKANYYQAKGINPFMEIALPQAVLQFKQGFGRLIRKKSDRGVIFVMDDRLMTKRYGKTFMGSIPEISVHYDHFEKLLNRVSKWL
ncbi:ATP-dependent DNA helicase DinG [Gracilibacillus caseinilyticus]|uniref:3'-5' exonuclease DinG n=1 Tax=Gracilibacillus caseinilyticus TaxID=2932256 RepID=A0ABY4F3J1_9BACI|nr:ATP-dependent DNA helicase DinG [Gracilibacillus caseinilyticus]UOQ50627.1 ATP-dependent DNA helicase DinG [Gracilibacillus caseinilyticus]